MENKPKWRCVGCCNDTFEAESPIVTKLKCTKCWSQSWLPRNMIAYIYCRPWPFLGDPIADTITLLKEWRKAEFSYAKLADITCEITDLYNYLYHAERDGVWLGEHVILYGDGTFRCGIEVTI